VKRVQSLLDVGVISNLIDEISGVLGDSLRLVENLLTVKKLAGPS